MRTLSPLRYGLVVRVQAGAILGEFVCFGITDPLKTSYPAIVHGIGRRAGWDPMDANVGLADKVNK